MVKFAGPPLIHTLLMKESTPLVTKPDGQKTPFLPDRLIDSLERVGANQGLIHRIITQVEEQFQPEMRSSDIYRLVYQELRKRSRPAAARYKLRKAIMELGPTGYPFEAYIGEIFRHLDYDIRVGIRMDGKCVTHEVDVLAERDTKRISIECKFGNATTKRIDVKVALYIQARFQDLVKAWKKEDSWAAGSFECWIVTNSSFTDDAIRYGACTGMRLVSWRYPQKGNLKDLIEHSGLFPITALASITLAEKRQLLSQGIVLAKDLLGKESLLAEIHVSRNRIVACQAEVAGLCCIED